MTAMKTPSPFSRRAVLALAGSGAGALLVAACGSNSDSLDSASSGAAEATSTTTPSPASHSAETNPASLRVIVNKRHPVLPVTWQPPDLVNFEGHQLRAQAADAARNLITAARKDGITLTVTSAYRSYAVQEKTYCHWVKQNGQQQADVLSARAGYSEHQTGLAIDFSSHEGCSLEQCYAQTKAGRWLAEHAVEYGYILRFPHHQQRVTGYVFEPWHYRYMGVELTKEYLASGTGTLEEFLGTGAAPDYV